MSDLSWKEQVALKRQQKDQTKAQARAAATANVAAKVSTTGWRSSGNGYLFKLKVSETMVSYYLGKGNMTLGRTQSSDKYDFEFHPMHTTGNPVYIRLVGNTDNSLMTKFDTKGRDAPTKATHFHNLGKLAEGENALTNPEALDMVALIGANYAFLQYMAKCIYEDDAIL